MTITVSNSLITSFKSHFLNHNDNPKQKKEGSFDFLYKISAPTCFES